MLKRRLQSHVIEALRVQAGVVLLGPRQVGKTTLALEIGKVIPSLHLDLEAPADRDKLAEPELFLAGHADKLVVIDEIQHAPELFTVLRGLIDRGRRDGLGTGRFLLLGSASIDLLKQSSESLAGRIAYRELNPIDVTEAGTEATEVLWERGGFPRSLLAPNQTESFNWRLDFLRTYLARDIPALGPRIPMETLRRLWTMIAHGQGSLLNASKLASNLNVSVPTVSRYIDLLVDLLLVRRLLPFHRNSGKRLVKSPKVYVRDSGMLHALLAISDRDALLGHPVVGASWEGHVIETLIGCSPSWTTPYFYRTAKGNEVDLILEMPGGEHWAIEIKRSLSPKVEPGFHAACDDIEPSRRLVVYAGSETIAMPHGIEAMSLHSLAAQLTGMWQT